MATLDRAGRTRFLRGVLLVGALLLMVASAAAYLHAILDGVPSAVESLRPRGADADPWAAAWLPALGALLLVIGLWRRSGLLWGGVALVAVSGAFFFDGVGWFFLAVALAFAAAASRLGVPTRRRRPA